MPAFRRKPVVVVAERLAEPVVVETLEGNIQANAGDWLIRGVRGELYPCKDDIFRHTYEPVDKEGVKALVARGPDDLGFPECIPFPSVTTSEIA